MINLGENIIKNVDNKNIFKIERKGKIDYYNITTNTIVGMSNKGDKISTIHTLTVQSKKMEVLNNISQSNLGRTTNLIKRK